MKPVAVDLFSGCGGLTLGLKQAGFRVLAGVDCDDLAVETYKTNHPGALMLHVDVRQLSVREVLRRLNLSKGDLDLLAGCPPCQGFSRMTTLNGAVRKRDERNDLVLEFIRFVRGMFPKAIMLENVPRLARDRRLRQVTRMLSRLGYEWETRILDAANFGVPQRRRRMILLGSRVGPVHFGEPAKTKVTVRETFGGFRMHSSDPLHLDSARRSPAVLRLIRAIPKNGGSRTDLPRSKQLRCHRRSDGFKDVYGRMAWDEVAPTITGGCCNPSRGRFLHPTKHRAITLREAALLQSFPPDYFFSLRRGRYAAAQLIGNALPPEFVRRHAKALHNEISRYLIRST